MPLYLNPNIFALLSSAPNDNLAFKQGKFRTIIILFLQLFHLFQLHPEEVAKRRQTPSFGALVLLII
jgi:hypothetical protein